MPLGELISYYLTNGAPYVALMGFALGLGALLFNLALRARLRRLTLGRNGSLEESVGILTRDLRDLKLFRAELERYLKHAEERLRSSVQGVGVVRFNPFSGDGSGGNQSFSLALLDEAGCGVVVSSLYARDRASVYAKAIDAWTSKHELSQEEAEAINRAKSQLAAHKK